MYALEIKNLEKKYKIYSKPSDRLKEIITRKPLHKDFTALNNISFNISHGEKIGIVGDNGAGKSTLLKILARTLTPTSGSIKINGNVAALLELGAGFHPEFTGRQNIYINASLLGLGSKQTAKIEKDIIEFSELGDFIDMPVKTYSSGMYVRLAFSIATSVNPDILIVDEALSVGDQYFQRKCIERMNSFCKSGKTIIFCSHNFYQLQELCEQGIWLHKGNIKLKSNMKKIVSEYQAHLIERDKDTPDNNNTREKLVFINKLWISDNKGKEIKELKTGDNIKLNVEIISNLEKITGHIGLGILKDEETLIFGSTTLIDNLTPVKFISGKTFSMEIKKIPLLTGKYKILCLLLDQSGLHLYDRQISDSFGVTSEYNFYGFSKMEHKWSI